MVACGGATEAGGGTVTGVVLLGPTCPVVMAESPCPDRPLENVVVRAYRADGTTAGEATSGADGSFEMSLPAGGYTLRADVDGDPGRSSKPVDVRVRTGGTTTVTVPVDSGIR
jgi:hypothetical protein